MYMYNYVCKISCINPTASSCAPITCTAAGQDFHILKNCLLLSLEVSKVNVFPAQFTVQFLYSHYLIIMSSSGGYTGTGTKADLDNHSNQCNPSNRNYQGYDSSYSGTGTKADLGNHSNQCNPNNPNYQAQKK